MRILFVDACIRGKDSRTLQLSQVFLHTLKEMLPAVEVTTHRLPDMGLQPVNAETLARKEKLCDACDWENPLFAAAREFQAADAVVIAAPYWDMSFPSILKVWVEHMYVRNLTFHYVDDQCIGLCRAGEAVYITTAGSPIGSHDWGTLYIRDVMQMLGIPGFTSINAQGLDLHGQDVELLMDQAKQEAVLQAKHLAQVFPSSHHPV